MNHNILFYSDKCEHSMNFIRCLQNEKMLSDFKLINVLELKEIPSMIENIPTIIVRNINVPLVGINAFRWLENNKYFYQGTNNINNAIHHISLTDDNSNAFDKSIIKRSDIYANIKDEDDDKLTRAKFNSAKQNEKITEIDMGMTISDIKLKSDIQTKKLNDLMQLRKVQIASLMKNTDNSSAFNRHI